MQNSMKSKCLEFLYAQVQKGNVSQIKKGMVEDFEAFVEGIRADDQAKRITDRMQLEASAKSLGVEQVRKAAEEKQEAKDETNS